MSTDFHSDLQAELRGLGEPEQQRVLAFVRALNRPVVGTPGITLASFAGQFPFDDLRQMEAAIDEGCEQVDLNAW